MKLAPHLHRLGNDLVACYLISNTAEGITLIDAGLPGHWQKDLQRGTPLSGQSPSTTSAAWS
ncbi:hypothetical protein [Streptomyces sp. KL116D]|uniref:hypothetical protein n=1 Tax=Streptomyces sp. KL116D TaxID=3045152 RepID=UPI0035582D66